MPTASAVADVAEHSRAELPDSALQGQLLDMAGTMLHQAVERALDEAQAHWFERASDARLPGEQQRLLDAHVALRAQRHPVRSLLFDHLKRVHHQVVSGAHIPARFGPEPTNVCNLSLMDQASLEEQLAGERLLLTCERRLGWGLRRFHEKAARSWNFPPEQPERNPIGPLHLVSAISTALKPLTGVGLDERLHIYQRLEHHLPTALIDLQQKFCADLPEYVPPLSAARLASSRPTTEYRKPPAAAVVTSAGFALGSAPAATPPPSMSDAQGLIADRQRPIPTRIAAPAPAPDASASPEVTAMTPVFADDSLPALSLPVQTLPPTTLPPTTLPAHSMPEPSLPPLSMPVPSLPPLSMPSMPSMQMPRSREVGDAMETLAPGSLLAGLSSLQGELVDELPAQLRDSSRSLADVLRETVMARMIELGLAADNAILEQREEQALLMVAMWFEVLLEQRTFSANMRAQFTRLSIVFLKAGLRDPHLLSQKDHPARRLLNALAEAADGNTGESAGDRELLAEIHQAVTTLSTDFDGDAQLFERQERALLDLLQRKRRSSRLAEQRASEARRGKERLQHARSRAEAACAAVLHDRAWPEPWISFLRDGWTHHLTVLELRQGSDSAEYADSLAVVQAAEGALRLAQDGIHAPRLDRDALRAIMASSGKMADAAAPVLRELQESLDMLAERQRQRWAAPAPRAPLAASEIATQATPVSTAPELAQAPAVEQPAPSPQAAAAPVVAQVPATTEPPTAREHLPASQQSADAEAIASLQVGDWVKIEDPTGQLQPAKLSWISPISQRILFVNRRGARLGVYSNDELLAMLRADKLVIHTPGSAFDLAMEQVLGTAQVSPPRNEHDRPKQSVTLR